jgi:RNA polymerase sigma-70 factor (ECF subfamily)
MMSVTVQQTTQADLAVVYQNLQQSLLGFIRKQVTDPVLAEDLLQDVFLKAINAIQRGDTPANLIAWLYTIARNSVIDHYRAKRPTDPLPDDLAAVDTDDHHIEQDLARCLKPLVQSLPPLYRNTLLATDFAGQPLQSLVALEKVSLSAIKSRASRGRKMLRQRLLTCCTINVSSSGQIEEFSSNTAELRLDKKDCCHE